MTAAAAISQLVLIKAFVLAGHAKFTLVSKKTGERKTFQVRSNDNAAGVQRAWFVDLLIGPDNQNDYRYLAYLFERGGKLYVKLNQDRWGADAYAAFVWLTAWFNGIGQLGFDERKFFDECEFWHAGECGKCGRELTDPESIRIGLGPVCAGRS